MAKKLQGIVKLIVKAQQATPQPPIGPALGQHGANIMEFCKAFNAQTQEYKPGTPLPVVIQIYADRSFTFQKKTPLASYLLLEAANLTSGSGEPNKKKVGKVTIAQIEEIAKIKSADLTSISLKAAMLTIAGTARSMGIEVEGIETLGDEG